MNHQEMIDVIHAHMDGKQVQYKSRVSEKGWVTLACPKNTLPLNFDNYDYRVKPEPREVYVSMIGRDCVVNSCAKISNQLDGHKYTLFREVIE